MYVLRPICVSVYLSVSTIPFERINFFSSASGYPHLILKVRGSSLTIRPKMSNFCFDDGFRRRSLGAGISESIHHLEARRPCNPAKRGKKMLNR